MDEDDVLEPWPRWVSVLHVALLVAAAALIALPAYRGGLAKALLIVLFFLSFGESLVRLRRRGQAQLTLRQLHRAGPLIASPADGLALAASLVGCIALMLSL